MSPFQRNGYWYTNVRWRYVDDEGTPRTKRVKKKIGTRKKDATDAEAMIRAQIAAGTYDPTPPVVPEAPRTFLEFATDEFLPWSEMQHSAAHHTELRRMIETRLTPFHELHLHEVTPKRITDYMQARRGKTYRRTGWKEAKRTSAATVNRELAALKAVFRQAVAWGRITSSPAAGVSALKEEPNPPRLLSGVEIARLLAEMPDHLRAAVGCAVYAGLRRTEILRLRWEDVDQKAKVLTVVSRAGRRTKSNKDRRIPISEPLDELLQMHPRTLGTSLLFPRPTNKDGSRPEGERHDFRTALNAAAKRAGLDGIGMHQLRHAFVSHALMAGVDPRTVQQWVGHADLRTTMRYAHTSPDHERAAIGRVVYRADEESRGVG